MHVAADGVPGEADSVAQPDVASTQRIGSLLVICLRLTRSDCAAAAFACGHEVVAGRLALGAGLGFDAEVLQQAVSGDAGRTTS